MFIEIKDGTFDVRGVTKPQVSGDGYAIYITINELDTEEGCGGTYTKQKCEWYKTIGEASNRYKFIRDELIYKGNR